MMDKLLYTAFYKNVVMGVVKPMKQTGLSGNKSQIKK